MRHVKSSERPIQASEVLQGQPLSVIARRRSEDARRRGA